MRIATFDTNVLVAGLRSTRGASFELLQRIGSGRFVLGLTTSLLLEYEEVLKRPGKVPLSSDDVDRLLDYLCLGGRLATVYFNVRPSARDPNDDFVLDAAVAASSEWIVTHNMRDLAEAGRQYGIDVLTPKDALRRLEDDG